MPMQQQASELALVGLSIVGDARRRKHRSSALVILFFSNGTIRRLEWCSCSKLTLPYYRRANALRTDSRTDCARLLYESDVAVGCRCRPRSALRLLERPGTFHDSIRVPMFVSSQRCYIHSRLLYYHPIVPKLIVLIVQVQNIKAPGYPSPALEPPACICRDLVIFVRICIPCGCGINMCKEVG